MKLTVPHCHPPSWLPKPWYPLATQYQVLPDSLLSQKTSKLQMNPCLPALQKTITCQSLQRLNLKTCLFYLLLKWAHRKEQISFVRFYTCIVWDYPPPLLIFPVSPLMWTLPSPASPFQFSCLMYFVTCPNPFLKSPFPNSCSLWSFKANTYTHTHINTHQQS